MSKAEAIIALSNNHADAFELAYARAIATDNDWEAESTIFTFDDNSTLTFSGAECVAGGGE